MHPDVEVVLSLVSRLESGERTCRQAKLGDDFHFARTLKQHTKSWVLKCEVCVASPLKLIDPCGTLPRTTAV